MAQPDPFEADPTMDKILDAAEEIGTEEALKAADEMINSIDETPKEN